MYKFKKKFITTKPATQKLTQCPIHHPSLKPPFTPPKTDHWTLTTDLFSNNRLTIELIPTCVLCASNLALTAFQPPLSFSLRKTQQHYTNVYQSLISISTKSYPKIHPFASPTRFHPSSPLARLSKIYRSADFRNSTFPTRFSLFRKKISPSHNIYYIYTLY